MRTLVLAVLITAASLTARGQGVSVVDAIYPFNLGSDVFTPNNATYGWSFQTTADLNVFQLGFFDAIVTAQNGPMTVGLWDSSGALIASTNITSGLTPGAGEVVTNGIRYQNVTPVSLQPQQTYRVGAFQDGAYSVNLLYSSNFTAGAGIRFDSMTWASTNGFAMPAPNNGFAGIIPGGATFRYLVPEPATTALLALSGFAALLWYRKPRS